MVRQLALLCRSRKNSVLEFSGVDAELLWCLWIFENFQEGGSDLDAQIEEFLNVEKQMRHSGDVAGTKKASTDILELCFKAGAWKTLNDQILVLSKRRGQLKQVPV